MNKLCVHLFIIIFIDVNCESEYIPTFTNFASILVNCFYFLRKITALWPSVLNFMRSARRVLPKKVLNKPSNNGFVGRSLRRTVLKI